MTTSVCHYTLNTDDTRQSPRSEVTDDVVTLLRPILTPGTHTFLPPLDDYTCDVTIAGRALMATVAIHGRPCVTFGVAPDDDAADLPISQIFANCSLTFRISMLYST